MIGDPGCLENRGFTMTFGTKLSTTKDKSVCACLDLRTSGASLLLVIEIFYFLFLGRPLAWHFVGLFCFQTCGGHPRLTCSKSFRIVPPRSRENY
jgi:hypothetical protein